MKNSSLLLGVLILCSSWGSIKNDIDFNEVLKRADFYRGGQVPGIVWDLKVDNIEKNISTYQLGLKIEGSSTETQQYALITYLSPKKYSGQKLLLRGNSMWFIKRGMRGPVPISGRQRLSGTAANTDVVAANYYQDYNIGGTTEGSYENVDCWVLELQAKNNLISYSKIKYWVVKDKNYGLKAEYYGKSGKLIKTGLFEYENEVEYKGEKKKYISKVIIYDAINKGDRTILDISNPSFDTFGNSKFQKSNLLD